MEHWEGIVRGRYIQATEVKHFRGISRAKQHRLWALKISCLVAKPQAISVFTLPQEGSYR